MSNLPFSPPSLAAVIFDIGDTLVVAAGPGTPVAELQVNLRPQVIEDLTKLQAAGLRLAAVTDTAVMTEADVRDLLKPSGLSDLLEILVTSCDVGAAKPNPLSLNTALERLGIAPDRALYIGDRAIDQEAAGAAGTHFAFIGETVTTTFKRWQEVGAGRFTQAINTWTPDHSVRSKAELAAQQRMDSLAKPQGSLGRLEALAVKLAGIAGACPPALPRPAAVAVFASDHGVHQAGVTAWPQEITVAMVETMAAGRAAVNALATAVDATVSVFDVGVANPISGLPEANRRRVRSGTRDLSQEPALTLAEASTALDIGFEVATELIEGGARCLVTGEMGIANSTAAAALIASFTNHTGAEVAGRGAGADDETLARKIAAIDSGLARHSVDDYPLELLASLGGLEIAAMAGFIVGAVTLSVPVIIDGAIANAALLAADRLLPGTAASVIAGHRSTEPAATIALESLGLVPLLDLDMRLGEGTGAVLALPLVEAAARTLSDVATIAELTT